MTTNRNILLLGGTGAMGLYLAPELAERGYRVKVIALDDASLFDHPRIAYVKADACDDAVLKGLLKERFDGMVDFLLYPRTEHFQQRYEMMLNNTDHYFFLSTYRIYGGDAPVTETTPRLLDVSKDRDFLATEDYALYKARQEDILQASPFTNWTIVRPSITYSKFRFQLVTLEAPFVVGRALKGLPIVLPKAALDVPTTMTWAGDTAKMFAGLLFNAAACRECFTLATAEHHTWREVADYYGEFIGLKYVAADTEDYIRIQGGSAGARYQLDYDRLFPRIIDNRKVLRVAGLDQADFMPLKSGLKKELAALPPDRWTDFGEVGARMDDYLEKHPHG